MIYVPKRFKHCTFESYKINDKNNQAFNSIQSYILNAEHNFREGKCFILSGNVGVGKTHLAYAIAKILDDKYPSNASDLTKNVTITNLSKILDSIKSTFSRNEEMHIYDHIRCMDTDWLIVDEVGVQFDTDKERMMLYDIFNYRYEHMKPTILLSNLDKKAIFKKLGKRICDRVFGGSEYHFIEGESNRR